MDITEDITEGEKMDQNPPSEYTPEVICELLNFFSENTYSLPSQVNEPRPYMDDVIKLLEKDYIVRKIENTGGKFCRQYPEVIPIMEACRYVTTIYEHLEESRKIDVTSLAELSDEAKVARCRQRFPVPVILLNNGKNICRSSTLASDPEICYRTGLTNVPGYELLQSVKEFWWPVEGLESSLGSESDAADSNNFEPDANAERICDKARNLDIKLLNILGIDTIVDIMVENRKVKHGLYVSASEKVYTGRYSKFKLVCLPFPGCEFFKKFHDAMFVADGLKYDFSDHSNDAVMKFPPDGLEKTIPVVWQDYKEWDVVKMTQNYIKYILKRLHDDNSTGLLLHCISGWDRTPLFISMLRLSLWADNLIHTSLNVSEILYLTLTYDWYLFGHHLSDRLYKNEEIMAFCFESLRYIATEDFSSKGISKKKFTEEMKSDESRNPSRSSNSSVLDDHNLRDEILLDVHGYSNDVTPLACTNNEDNQSLSDSDCFVSISLSTYNFDSCKTPPRDDTLMDTIFEDTFSQKVASSTSLTSARKTSPIPVAGSRRQRSDSSGSSNSNSSSAWQLITEAGSVEQDLSLKPIRYQRLEDVRTLFNTCYYKSVKRDSFGPKKGGIIEEVVKSLSGDIWSKLVPETKNGNDEIGSSEMNGNAEKIDDSN